MFKLTKYISLDLLLYFIILLYSVSFEFFSIYSFYPIHDTLFDFQLFYTFYNELLINNIVTLWSPYHVYGGTFDFYYSAFSSSQYFLAVIGKLFNIKDVITVFKLSILFEKFIFLLGVFLLSKKIFTNKKIVIYIGIGALLTIFTGIQIGFNFRIYYSIPFVLYLIRCFFQEKKIVYLLYLILFGFFSTFGAVLYIIPFHILIYVVYIGFMVYQFRFPKIEISKHKFILFGTTAILFILLFFMADFIFNLLNGMALHTVGRDVDGKIKYDSYLTYVSYSNPAFLLEALYAIPSIFASNIPDVVFFIGYIPIIFFIYAIIKVKNITMYFFSSIIFILFLESISYSSFIAPFLYNFFPGIKYTRHISYLTPILKILILFVSGFGFNYFRINRIEEKSYNHLIYIGFGLIILVLVLDLNFQKIPYRSFTDPFVDLAHPKHPQENLEGYFYFHYLSLIVVFFLLIFLFNRKSSSPVIILIFYFIEIASYHSFINHILPNKAIINQDHLSNLTVEDYKKEFKNFNSLYQVQKFDYAEKRFNQSDFNEIRPASNRIMNLYGTQYVTSSISLYFDFCFQPNRYEYTSISVDQLFRAKLSLPIQEKLINSNYMESANKIIQDYDFRSAVGCETDKLRITQNVNIATIDEEAASQIRGRYIYETPIVLDENGIYKSFSNPYEKKQSTTSIPLNKDNKDTNSSSIQVDTEIKQMEETINGFTSDENLNFSEKQFNQITIKLPIKNFYSANLKYTDMNGDSLTDMVYLDQEANKIYINLNSTNGFQGFTLWKTISVGGRRNKSGFFLVNLNTDNHKDLVYYTLNSENNILIYAMYSNETGFQEPFFYESTTIKMKNESQFHFADFNGDGFLDIYLVDIEKSKIYIGLNSNNQIAPMKEFFGIDKLDLSQVQIADVNGDKKADIVFYNQVEKKFYVSLSDGTKFKRNSVWFFFLGDGIDKKNYFVTDINNDGVGDLVFFNKGFVFLAESDTTAFHLKIFKTIKINESSFQMSKFQPVEINNDDYIDFVYIKDESNLVFFTNKDKIFAQKEVHLKKGNYLKPKKFHFVNLNSDQNIDIVFYNEKIEVTQFTANSLELKVNLSANDKNSWLLYLDSFHPSWRVTVDGVEKPIARVNLAFKAVYLEEIGIKNVKFEFLGNHRTKYYIPFFMGLNTIFSLVLLGVFFSILFCRFRFRLK